MYENVTTILHKKKQTKKTRKNTHTQLADVCMWYIFVTTTSGGKVKRAEGLKDIDEARPARQWPKLTAWPVLCCVLCVLCAVHVPLSGTWHRRWHRQPPLQASICGGCGADCIISGEGIRSRGVELVYYTWCVAVSIPYQYLSFTCSRIRILAVEPFIWGTALLLVYAFVLD